MAKVVSRIQFDMRSTGNMSVHDLLKGKDAKFDNHFIRLEYLKSHERDTFKGSFTANPSSKTISGSAKSWTHSKNGRLQWEITNAAISASAVLKAAKTKSTKDDLAVIEKSFAGNDSITGSKFADKLFGYAGNDTINGGGDSDKIDGGSGHDAVSYSTLTKAVDLTLTGSTISVALVNGVANDRIVNVEDIVGGKGADKFTGDKQANLLVGNNGSDTLIGGKGNDTLLGGKHNDSLVGGAGKDSLDGGKGADVLEGGAGNDTLLGGDGPGADSLDGGAGNDSLDGGAGNDLLVGGLGRDTLKGGTEADTFKFVDVAESGITATTMDLITDFKHKLDKIDVSGIDAITSTPGVDDAFVWDGKGTAKTKHVEGHFGYYQVNAKGTANDHTYIVFSNDADKKPEMIIELQGLIKLGPVDFIL